MQLAVSDTTGMQLQHAILAPTPPAHCLCARRHRVGTYQRLHANQHLHAGPNGGGRGDTGAWDATALTPLQGGAHL